MSTDQDRTGSKLKPILAFAIFLAFAICNFFEDWQIMTGSNVIIADTHQNF